MERDVFFPTASCSWVSVFSAQVEHWDLGGLASLARAAPVRLGDLVLFLSCNMMVSKKLSYGDQDLNTYGIFDASKSYRDIGVRGVLVITLSNASSFSEERETHNFLELDQRGLRLYDCLSIPD